MIFAGSRILGFSSGAPLPTRGSSSYGTFAFRHGAVPWSYVAVRFLVRADRYMRGKKDCALFGDGH